MPCPGPQVIRETEISVEPCPMETQSSPVPILLLVMLTKLDKLKWIPSVLGLSSGAVMLRLLAVKFWQKTRRMWKPLLLREWIPVTTELFTWLNLIEIGRRSHLVAECWGLQSFNFHEAAPWPSKVPPPVRSKPSMFSNRIQSPSAYSLRSVVAFTMPRTSTVIALLHGPEKTTGPVRNVPEGIRTFAGAPDPHAFAQVSVNACSMHIYIYVIN